MMHRVILDKVEVVLKEKIGDGENAYAIYSIRVAARVDDSQVYIVRFGLHPGPAIENILRRLEQDGVEAAYPRPAENEIEDEKYLPF